jgi:hypothetical protein
LQINKKKVSSSSALSLLPIAVAGQSNKIKRFLVLQSKSVIKLRNGKKN